MENECNIYEDVEYKFVDFTNILTDIKFAFFDDIELFEIDYPLKLDTVILRRYLKHSTLVEILKGYKHINMSKVNAILIPNDISFNSNGLIADDSLFIGNILRVIDSSKRSIPILIKRLPCTFKEINTFLLTGEGKDFITQIERDREKLRKKVCTFEQFKKFARKEKLIYIIENLIDKIEFKRLFIS